MNLDMIRVTENYQDMINIGREIIVRNKEKYTEKTLAMIENSVRERVQQTSDEEINDLVLCTIYHYWVYGSTYDEFFYYDFRNKSHAQKMTYMTFRIRLLYMDYLNDKNKKHLLFNKYETFQLFKEQYMRDVILCSSSEDYSSFYDFTQKHKEFVVKPTDMSGGRGVYKASVKGKSETEIKCMFDDLLMEAETNKEKYMRGSGDSFVIEELIEQADELAMFNNESINGVRVPTININGDITIYQPWLKIGRGGNFLTSAVFGTLDAGIDGVTGIIDTPGMNEIGEVFDQHPDNGLPIVGFQVPRWDELILLAKKCAKMLPEFRYIGWDFALTPKGWCIMEANYSGDFMWQLYRQKGMRQEFEDLIGWRLDKEFWWQ